MFTSGDWAASFRIEVFETERAKTVGYVLQGAIQVCSHKVPPFR